MWIYLKRPYLWTGASITLVLAAISFYILARIHKVIIFEIAGKTNSMCNTEGKTDILNEKKRHSIIPYEENYLFENLENVLLNTYSMLFLVSLSKLPKAWPLRVLTGWWCLYCLLITVAYKASMTAILTRPAVRITIDTLDQLASSSVSCGGWDSQSIDFFLMSLDTAGQEIGRKFEVINDINDGIKRTSQGQFAYYDNIYFLKHVIREQMDTRNQSETNQSNINSYRNNKIINSTNLHVMQECVVNMPVALGLQKNSPLKSTIDNVLLRIVESGLVKQWLHDVLVTTEHPENLFPEKGFMDLPKIYVALIALAIGYITSCCILIVENIGWHYFVKSNPLFDKYNKY